LADVKDQVVPRPIADGLVDVDPELDGGMDDRRLGYRAHLV
jgi:hypothetical protein